MDETQVALTAFTGGMNGGLNPLLLPENTMSRTVNCQSRDQLLTTRIGCRSIPINGDEVLSGLNIQGACWFNPAKGQSQQTFAKDLSRIVLAAGGRKFEFVFTGAKARLAQSVVKEITGVDEEENPLIQKASLHLVWMFPAEIYVIAGDGRSETWIYDTVKASFSTGYTEANKAESKLANGATAGIYAHGRICQTINSRQIIVGDIIHKADQGNPKNILDTTEQVYWNTGSFFSPPSAMGNVLAVQILPLRNTQHGHGELMWHCEDGVFSLEINVSPRSAWGNQQLVRHALLDTGARGPFCIVIDDGDQMFRSKHGIQTLRSAAAEASAIGNPQRPISSQVSTWLKTDYDPFVRFCSMAKWVTAKRIFCTTGLWVKGVHRGGKGFVSLNLEPIPGDQNSCWEGLWTLPSWSSKPVQFVSGNFGEQDRTFCFTYNEKNKIGIVEFDESLDYDVGPDGEVKEISCQAITREIGCGDILTKKEGVRGTLLIREARRSPVIGVWVRTGHKRPWIFWKSVRLCRKKKTGEQTPEDVLIEDVPYDEPINLGVFPGLGKHARKFQLLLRWKGYVQFESITIITNPKADPEQGRVTEKIIPLEGKVKSCYNDYEYSEDTNRWEEALT
jgi:hypothetical protein